MGPALQSFQPKPPPWSHFWCWWQPRAVPPNTDHRPHCPLPHRHRRSWLHRSPLQSLAQSLMWPSGTQSTMTMSTRSVWRSTRRFATLNCNDFANQRPDRSALPTMSSSAPPFTRTSASRSTGLSTSLTQVCIIWQFDGWWSPHGHACEIYFFFRKDLTAFLQKLNAQRSTSRIASTSGRVRATTRFGLQLTAPARVFLTMSATMCRRPTQGKLPMRLATKSPRRAVSRCQRKFAFPSPTRFAKTSLWPNVRRFPAKLATRSTDVSRSGWARLFQKRAVEPMFPHRPLCPRSLLSNPRFLLLSSHARSLRPLRSQKSSFLSLFLPCLPPPLDLTSESLTATTLSSGTLERIPRRWSTWQSWRLRTALLSSSPRFETISEEHRANCRQY